MTAKSDLDFSPITIIEGIRRQDKWWEVLAPRYGVTNPNPPWTTSLEAMCECLDVTGALPALDRRKAEDDVIDVVYADVPAPERQLLALAHIMLNRGFVAENDLANRMQTVRSRLEAA